MAKLKAGASFAAVAESSSIDAQTAAGGGALGCDFTAVRGGAAAAGPVGHRGPAHRPDQDNGASGTSSRSPARPWPRWPRRGGGPAGAPPVHSQRGPGAARRSWPSPAAPTCRSTRSTGRGSTRPWWRRSGRPPQYLLAAVSASPTVRDDAQRSAGSAATGRREHRRHRRLSRPPSGTPCHRCRRTLPRIDVVGLGPAGPELITAGARALLAGPTGSSCGPAATRRPRPSPRARTSTTTTRTAETFDEVYRAIVDDLVAAALDRRGPVVYAVPGSPIGGRAHGGAAAGDHPRSSAARSGGGPSVGVLPRPGLRPPGRGPGGRRGAGGGRRARSPSRRPGSGARCWWPSAGAARCCRTSSCRSNRHRRT